MTSTYAPNTGIELIGTGDQSGLWGDTTNLNLQIIDRLTNGVGAISLSGTTYTLTMSDGLLSEGQYKVLVFGGSPSGTNTVTIAPNTAQHMYVVKNNSGQSVILTQGSGSTVTVANGTSKLVYCDGVGAASAVTDVTATFAMSSVTITGGSITGITDLAIADGGTGASSAATALTNLGAAPTISPALTGNVTVTSNSSSAALTVTQTGAGNAFVVEDSANPDSTPFIVDAAGNVGVGTSGPSGYGNTGRFAVQTASSTDGIVATFANSGSTGAAIQLFQTGISTATIGMPAGAAGITFAPSGTTERMRIDTSGNVGIGTATPNDLLQIVAANPSVVTTRTSDFYYSKVSADGIAAFTNANGDAPVIFKTATTERMRIDTSGNVGIGVTPSAWSSVFKTVELGTSTNPTGAIGATSGGSYLSFNTYYSSGAQWLYKTTQSAAYYAIESNAHKWYNAPSGTAGNAITFTQAMTLDASGNFMVGTTSPSSSKFRVVGADTSAIGLINGASYGIRFGSAAGIGANIDAVDVGGVTSYQPLIVGGSTLGLQTGGTQRVLIDASGNVGIGTTSPSARLQANNTINTVYSPSDTLTSGTIAYIRNDSSTNATAATLRLDALGSADVAAVSISAVHTGDAASALTFGTRTNASSNVTERLRIDASGNVGIGTASPTTKLDVSGTVNATALSIGGTALTATATELNYVSGVTSAIQTQLNAKQATITGAATTVVSSDLTASRALASNASGKVVVSTVTDTELGYVSGVTSAIQTQLNSKASAITGGASTIVSSDLTASRALASNASGKVVVSTVTDTELGYVSGVTSAIQTQIDGKAPLTGTGTSGTWPISISGDAATTDGKSFGTFTAAGGIAYATNTTTLAAIGAGTTGQALLSAGASAPTWGYPAQLSTASGSAPSYACRVWVSFNGSGSILSSGNVSSVTGGPDTFTINFTTALPTANFALSGSTDNSGYGIPSVSARSTTAVTVIWGNRGTGGGGGSWNSIMIFA